MSDTPTYHLPTSWSTLDVRGGDRVSFLNNFCTNQLSGLDPGACREAFFPDVKGKIVAHALVLVDEDRIRLLLPAQPLDALLGHLDRYIIREDVTLADATEQTTWKLASEAVDGGYPCDILGSPGTLLESDNTASRDPDALEPARIQAGFPLFGVDFGPESLPQEVNRDAQSLSFTKGCYLGQETVARIDALGHVNKRVTRFTQSGPTPPSPGDRLMAGDAEAGEVTSITEASQSGPAAGLATIRRGHWEPGTVLQHDGGSVEVTV